MSLRARRRVIRALRRSASQRPTIGCSGAARVLQAQRPPGDGHGRPGVDSHLAQEAAAALRLSGAHVGASRTGIPGPSPERPPRGEPKRLRFAVPCSRCARDHIAGAGRVSTLTGPALYPRSADRPCRCRLQAVGVPRALTPCQVGHLGDCRDTGGAPGGPVTSCAGRAWGTSHPPSTVRQDDRVCLAYTLEGMAESRLLVEAEPVRVV